MRIGILPNLSAAGGGVYQYSHNILHALNAARESGHQDQFILFFKDTLPPLNLSNDGWEIRSLGKPPVKQTLSDALRQMIGEGPHRDALRWLRRQWMRSRGSTAPEPKPDQRRWYLDCQLDLMLYPFPTSISFESGVPYVMTIHDLQHRLQPEFPEVSADGEWESREYLFRNGCRYASLIVADSEVGKEDILEFYGDQGVTADKVKVLPYLPAAYLAADVSENERRRVRSLYQLPARYFFYPAQFWPHKNHARIIRALALLKAEYHTDVSIVFCGSHTGEIREKAYRKVLSITREAGVESETHYLGYVPDQDMSALYAGAVALIMPTFFGPTNIPVVEAWSFDCPVLTSDIRGIREQVGDAAVLVDPRSVESIAEGMVHLWTDDCLRRALIAAGRRRIASYTPEHFRNRLMGILQEAKDRVRFDGQRNP